MHRRTTNTALALARDLAHDLDRRVEQARGPALGHGLDRAITVALDHAYALVRALEQAATDDLPTALAEALRGSLARAHDLAGADTGGRNLLPPLARAKDRAKALHGVLYDGRTAEAPAATAGPVGRTVVALAVQVLPTPNRARYREEFHSELAELSRAERAAWSCRLLLRAWGLRSALASTLTDQSGEQPRRVRS